MTLHHIAKLISHCCCRFKFFEHGYWCRFSYCPKNEVACNSVCSLIDLYILLFWYSVKQLLHVGMCDSQVKSCHLVVVIGYLL